MRLHGDGRIARRPLNRVRPRTPVRGMITYRVASPIATHTRPASCAEVECKQWRKGWDSVVPRTSPDPAALTEATVRAAAGGLLDGITRTVVTCTGPRHESCPDDSAGMVRLHFPPGQTCFRSGSHRVSLERPEIYTVRGGDWRQNLGLIRRHIKPEHWVEDSQENFDAVRKQVGA